MSTLVTSCWFSNVLFFLLGALTSWLINRYFYLKAHKDSAPGIQLLVEVHRKLQTGSMTKDQAAHEIIKGLEIGALSPTDLRQYEWLYKFCPDCKGDVEVIGSWSAYDYNAFGGTMKCKKCSWKKDFSG